MKDILESHKTLIEGVEVESATIEDKSQST